MELTYGEALDRIERAAAGLRAAGVGPGDRVLHTPRNHADHLLAWLALMEVGATQVPLNPKSTAAELAGFVEQVDAALVVTDADLAPLLGDGPVPVVHAADLYAAEPDGRGPADVDPDDVAVMIPTSGTTGRSKLVMQTHRAYVMAGEGFPWWLELTADDRLMTTLPLFHINAPAYSTLGSVAAGASLVLLPAFSGSGFLDDARRYGATEFNSIGAMLEILLRQPERDDDADNPLRLCYTGPSPSEERQLEAEARFGLRITCGYALSESPYGTVWRHGTRPYGTLGAVRQHPTLGHVNDGRVMADGAEVAVGEEGELELRNPAIMKGYYEMPEETAAVRRRRLAEDRRHRPPERGRDLHVHRAQEGGHPPPGREPQPGRGGGRPRTPSRRGGGGGHRRRVRPVRGGGQGLRRPRRRASSPTCPP